MTKQFIQERRYLLGVSPRTIIWYQCSFKAFEGAMSGKETVRQGIVDLRQRNVSPITIDSYLRCINAYFTCLHLEHGKEPLKIPKLKEEQKILSTFTEEQIQATLSFKPKGRNRKQDIDFRQFGA